MDAQRALLDSLMGLNRDGDRPNEATLDLSHPRENDVKRDFRYERQLANELSKLLVDVEKKITRAQKRLDEDRDDNQDRTQVLQDMQDATSQAEQAAKDGNVDKSLQLMEHVELLKRKRRELLRQSNANSNVNSVAMMVDNVNQKLRVCGVCGAFLSIFDSDRRLADHFGGKVHVGYVQIRKKFKELMEKIKANKEDELTRRRPVDRLRREEQPRRRNDSGPEHNHVDDRERRRDRDRSRSRERRRQRDRSNGRSRRRRRSESPSRSPERKRSRSHRYRH